MELDLIEMVAYLTPHTTTDEPWRCVACEKITHHADADIAAHLLGAHGLTEVHRDRDEIFVRILAPKI